MPIETVLTSSAPAPVGPYSQAVKANGFLFLSGQIALDPATGAMAGGDIAEQTRRVMENLKAVLEVAGAGLEGIVKSTIFITDMSKFAAVNEVYGSYFPSSCPARSTVEVSRLPKDALVEIECVAVI